MWLPYEYAFEMAVGLLALYLMLRYINRENDMRNVRIVVSVTQELIVLLTLYGLWQYIHELAVTKTAGAIENARRLWDFQRWLHLPSSMPPPTVASATVMPTAPRRCERRCE